MLLLCFYCAPTLFVSRAQELNDLGELIGSVPRGYSEAQLASLQAVEYSWESQRPAERDSAGDTATTPTATTTRSYVQLAVGRDALAADA